MAVQAHATAKYVRTSAQKAGLVMNLIRGRDVNSHSLVPCCTQKPAAEIVYS